MADSKYRKCDNDKCHGKVFILPPVALKRFSDESMVAYCPFCESTQHHGISREEYRKERRL